MGEDGRSARFFWKKGGEAGKALESLSVLDLIALIAVNTAFLPYCHGRRFT